MGVPSGLGTFRGAGAFRWPPFERPDMKYMIACNPARLREREREREKRKKKERKKERKKENKGRSFLMLASFSFSFPGSWKVMGMVDRYLDGVFGKIVLTRICQLPHIKGNLSLLSSFFFFFLIIP